jgi:CRP-like cAMP-binding protein
MRRSAISTDPTLKLMLRKFERRGAIDEADRAALLALPHRVHSVEPTTYVVREGDRPDRACLILSGFAYRHKVTVDGARQIVSVHIPGDFVDLEGSLLNIADHNVQALTRCEMAYIPRDALRALILGHPRIAMAMWIDTLIDGSIFREWVVNVGRRDARSRIAHLLCEFARRMEVAGLADEYRYELPMTQEQLADATGLTPVHVNRVLKTLDREGLIRRDRRFIAIPDWPALRQAAGFSEIYLHLDQVPHDIARPAA